MIKKLFSSASVLWSLLIWQQMLLCQVSLAASPSKFKQDLKKLFTTVLQLKILKTDNISWSPDSQLTRWDVYYHSTGQGCSKLPTISI